MYVANTCMTIYHHCHQVGLWQDEKRSAFGSFSLAFDTYARQILQVQSELINTLLAEEKND